MINFKKPFFNRVESFEIILTISQTRFDLFPEDKIFLVDLQ